MNEKTLNIGHDPSPIDELGLGEVRDRTKSVLTYYFITAAIESLIVVLLYMGTPVDPKNIFLFGYSKSRLFLISLFLIIALISILGTIRLWRDSKWEQRIVNSVNTLLDEYRWFAPFMILLFGIVILSPYVYLIIKGPLLGSLLRLFPLILFAVTRTLQTLIVFLVLIFTNGTQRTAATQNANIIRLNPKKILVLLTAFAVLLFLASLSGDLIAGILTWDQTVWRYFKWFDLDLERSFPTYFSSLILILSSILLSIIAVIKRREKDYFFLHWAFLAFIFLFLSIDEAIALHEYSAEPLTKLFNPSGLFYFAWVIIAIPLVILLAVAYRRFLFYLPVKSRLYFILAAVLYITGALILEMLEARHVELYSGDTFYYISVSSTEEILEILGILLFIYALLEYLKTQYSEIQFRLVDRN